jgi:hypothetical protein
VARFLGSSYKTPMALLLCSSFTLAFCKVE